MLLIFRKCSNTVLGGQSGGTGIPTEFGQFSEVRMPKYF